MNKSIRFGYHEYTKGYFVKLNVKLREKDAQHLQKKYPGLATITNGKQGVRIEGTLLNDEMSKFHFDLEIMKLDYKIEEMIIKKEKMIDAILPKVNIEDEIDLGPYFPF